MIVPSINSFIPLFPDEIEEEGIASIQGNPFPWTICSTGQTDFSQKIQDISIKPKKKIDIHKLNQSVKL